MSWLTNMVPQGGYSGGGYSPPNMTSAANLGFGNIANIGPSSLPGGSAIPTNAVNSLIPQWQQTQQYGQQFANQAFDPQQQLYNYMQGQNMNQTNAGLAQRGLSMSPVGAQIGNQSNQNFNMNWQNQQLAREQQGIQGLGATASTLGNLGNTYGSMATLPSSMTQQQINDWMTYMGIGQQGDRNAVSAWGATAQPLGAGLGSLYNSVGGLGGIASGIGNLFSSGASFLSGLIP